MKPRLSGQNYFDTYSYGYVKVGKWKTDQRSRVFDYCKSKNCASSNEHEYAFDGQVFYKKKELKK